METPPPCAPRSYRRLHRLIAAWALCLSLSACCLTGRAADASEQASAPTEVTAVIFTDFYSAPCAEVNQLLDQLAQTRHLTLQKLYKHVPANPDAMPAHEASLAAGAQGKFKEMHDLLFKQTKPAGSALLRMAKSLDLDLKRFENALDDREFRSIVLRDIAEARGLGVNITPTVFLNGTKVQGLEELRALLRTPARPAPPAWEATPVESLALNFEGSPTSGTSNSPVTIVEFTDFRCGFCRIHSRVLSELTAAYPGRIYRVFKNYPIDPEGAGMQPHLAALAALDQGRFWEMHQSIMTKPLEPGADLLERAKSMGLDLDTFQRSLAAPAKRDLIRRDIAEGEQLGIRATPTTFMNGKRLVGRQSLESLKKHVEELQGAHAVIAGGPTNRSTTLGDPQAAEHIEAFIDLGDLGSLAWIALLKDLVAQRPGVQVQFYHFPLQRDPARIQLHEAAMAAADQGRFWEMCNQIEALKIPASQDTIKSIAGQLGLDPVRFGSALTEHRHAGRIEADVTEGRRRGLKGPSLFLNGEQFKEIPTLASLARHLDDSACCGRAVLPGLLPPGVDHPVAK